MTDLDLKITGSNRHLISLALAWAVATIDLLPKDMRSMGDEEDMHDMRAILDEMVGKTNADRSLNDKRFKIQGAKNGGA